MRRVRVLIVAGSTVIRRQLRNALADVPAIEVGGVAASGQIALAKIPQISPDLVILSLEMPDTDELRTLTELRKSFPHLPVIMWSALPQDRTVAMLNALSLGACDYVTKPVNIGNTMSVFQHVREARIPKIKALCGIEDGPNCSLPARTVKAKRPISACTGPVQIIAIGVSTGGPKALADIFRQLPGDLPVPIVLVQHMPADFTKYLAERLNAISPLEVREAKDGDRIEAGQAWLAPGNYHMSLDRAGTGTIIRLHQGPPENSCRPAVDVLFRSVAELFGPASLAVVLTGMGQDGLRGCEAIRDAGGQIIVQDKVTSVIWGMPGAVANMGLANQVLPLAKITEEIIRLTTGLRGRKTPNLFASIDL